MKLRSRCMLDDMANGKPIGTDLRSIQLEQGRSDSTGKKPGKRVGPAWYSRQHNLARVHCDSHGGGSVCQVPRETARVANAEHAGQAEQA